jgi:glycosyltransferase involved in cell wall biosynthesis
MNILQVHNYYQTPGGEDVVVANERQLLEKHGHTVIPYYVHSDSIKKYSAIQKLLFFPKALYNPSPLKPLTTLIKLHKIDIVHIHNFWPLISPSIFFLLNRLGIPYIQTIHNYRYIVPDATLLKEDVDCSSFALTLQKRSLRCYQNSLPLTLLYTAIGQFVRHSKVIAHGCGRLQLLNKLSYEVHRHFFPAHKLLVRGNFLPALQANQFNTHLQRTHLLYLGRLSSEKGILTLIAAYKLSGITLPLLIAGSGPLIGEVKNAAQEYPGISFAGFVQGEEKNALLSSALALILPSEWQEVFPISLLEANFAATPVLGARIGGIGDLVVENHTGLLFESGSVQGLAAKLQWCEHNQAALQTLGRAALQHAEQEFSESKAYQQMMQHYAEVVALSS